MHVNGVQVSEGNLGDMDWTFAEIIERASYGARFIRVILLAVVRLAPVVFSN